VASLDTRFLRALGVGQGVFYVGSGLWPLADGASFQRVTGFKADFWLAQTVGLLLAVSGLVLISAAWRRRLTPEVVTLAVSEALVLAAVDVYCVPQPRTTPVYFMDAVVEICLAVLWIYGGWRGRREENR